MNTCCLLPESFLCCMLIGEGFNTREQALVVIKKFWTSKDNECCVTNIADVYINFHTISWTEMIDFMKRYEPESTKRLKEYVIDVLIAVKEVQHFPEFYRNGFI